MLQQRLRHRLSRVQPGGHERNLLRRRHRRGSPGPVHGAGADDVWNDRRVRGGGVREVAPQHPVQERGLRQHRHTAAHADAAGHV